MKKINVLLAALTLAVTALTPLTSSAAALTGDSGTTEVSMSVNSSYTVTIPDSVTQLEVNDTLQVTAADVLLHYNEKLVVSVASENGWKLKDKEHSENNADISYTLNIDGNKVTNDAAVLVVPYDLKNKSANLTVAEIGDPTYAGTYSDTLTFNVKTEDITTTPAG